MFQVVWVREAPSRWDSACPSISVCWAHRRKRWDLFSCWVGFPWALEFGTAAVQSFRCFAFRSALGLETFHKLNLKMKPNILIKEVSSPVANPM